MGDIIRQLPDNVANQIAAGEVVQRPASVVKELLENSVDAGAGHIQLLAREAGKSGIQVIDDGAGMTETDARMAFERHATSKIESAEDIFAILTKGFRGEALASIAAVAQVELKSRPKNQELGTFLRIEGGRSMRQEFCSTAAGTQIDVQHLFYNIPARRNFLKSDNVELRHMIDEFERVALAHPSIHFRMQHNGSDLFDLPASSIRQRIVGVFGKKFNEKLVPVEEETPLVKLSGYVGKPQYARKTRGEQFFFTNYRFIKNGYLHRAVCKAFEGLLPPETHPSYFLYLELDPARIDVNIHPTKTEIKFEDDKAIHTIVRTAVRHALGQHNISPTLDFDTDQQFTPHQAKGPVEAPGVHINPHFNPFDSARSSPDYQAPPSTTSPSSPHPGRESTAPVSRQSQEWESMLNKLPEIPEEKQEEILAHQEPTGRRYLQIARKYILTHHADGMLMVHQHRAHSRVLMEQLLQDYQGGKTASQQLLFPLELSFTSGEMALLRELFPTLRELGFDLEESGSQQISIQGMPYHLDKLEPRYLFEKMLEDEKDHRQLSSEDLRETVVQTMAQLAAIRSGTLLDQEEMADLVERLMACQNPSLSASGDPTMLHFKQSDLDNYF